MEPDFYFKCRVTGKEFYVEAKWRAKPYKDLYQVLSDKQFKSFPALNSAKCPIFIAFGYGGQPSNPDYISLIPLDEVQTPKLSPTKVSLFNIKKAHYPPSFFTVKDDGNRDNQEESNFEKELPLKGRSRPDKKLLGLAAVGLLAIVMIIYSFAFSNEGVAQKPEEQLKEIVADYYQSMNSNQIERLPAFLSPQVTSWYGAQNPTREEIYRNAKAHRGKYPFSSSNIDWESFQVIPAEAGGYRVTFEMIYRSKAKITDDYTVYDLKLITQWDDNFKLKGITEIRK